MERYLLILIAAATVVLAGSCSPLPAYFRVVEGNYAFSRGEYKTANYEYIRAMREEEQYDRIFYNIGNVYHALGEGDAALSQWKEARDQEDTSLMYRIAFNRGVLFYEMGNYTEAYSMFRRALKYHPEDVEAKTNLEYCLRKMNIDEEQQPQRSASSEEQKPLSDDAKRILEYIERSAPTLMEPERSEKAAAEGKDW
jgi:Ca-activated chloride channel family protein